MIIECGGQFVEVEDEMLPLEVLCQGFVMWLR